MSTFNDIPRRLREGGQTAQITLAETVTQATIAAINTSDGTGVVASAAANRRCVGIYREGGDSGDIVTAEEGLFMFANGDSITNANIGALAYVGAAAKTVYKATGTYSLIVGVIREVTSDGVWVDTVVKTAAAVSAS